MALRETLTQIAIMGSNNLSDRASALRDKILGLNIELQKAQLQLEMAEGAPDRLESYTAELRMADICPHCWIGDGIRNDVRAIGGGTAAVDLFRCSGCREVFEVDA